MTFQEGRLRCQYCESSMEDPGVSFHDGMKNFCTMFNCYLHVISDRICSGCSGFRLLLNRRKE